MWYELIITVKKECINKVLEAFENTGLKVYIIGETIEENKVLYEEDGEVVEVQDRGWEYFR